jgi:hypothetical protein
MAAHPGLFSTDGQAWRGVEARQAGDCERHILPQQDRLPVAYATE